MRSLRLGLLVLVVALISPGSGRAEEAAKVRVLLVLDTLDRNPCWGLDGENVRQVFEAALKKQKLEGRYTFDAMTGKQVTPKNILDYYRALQTGPNETLLFYYSGHGGSHYKKGHFLAFTQGKLYRKDLVAQMQKHNPQLTVLLTDCCANFSAFGSGAQNAEPPGALSAIQPGEGRGGPKANRQEPPGAVSTLFQVDPTRDLAPPRPDFLSLGGTTPPAAGAGPKAKREEPPESMSQMGPDGGKGGPKANKEEPPGSESTKVTSPRIRLITGRGMVSREEIAEKTDGAALRDLLFRHKGLVDINGCQTGFMSFGTTQWGGSTFTNGLLDLLRDPINRFDTNGNNLVEWTEFYPALRDATGKAISSATQGKEKQIPQSFGLGQLAP